MITIKKIEVNPGEVNVNNNFQVIVEVDGIDELLNATYVKSENLSYVCTEDNKKIKLEGR